jgi:hypothetical protein
MTVDTRIEWLRDEVVRSSVERIAQLRARQERADLVGENLLRRVHPDVTDALLGQRPLRHALVDQIDHDRFLTAPNDAAAEGRRRLDLLDRRAQLAGCKT